MEEQENNETKILIDALKYTSNIIVDLTNKLTLQEEKINILENKLNKIQKVSMENNFKLKTIDFDKLNLVLKSSSKKISSKNIQNKNNNDSDNSDNMSEYIIEKNITNKNYQNNNTNQTQSNQIITQPNKIITQTDIPNCDLKDKNKIDKLIGSIVKRKNALNQMINDNKEKSILEEEQINQTRNMENSGLDLTIKTGTTKTEIIDNKSYRDETAYNDMEQDKIIKAQNNDLDKANNILKQIRKRGNFTRKI
jgi:hypothetical protein